MRTLSIAMFAMLSAAVLPLQAMQFHPEDNSSQEVKKNTGVTRGNRSAQGDQLLAALKKSRGFQTQQAKHGEADKVHVANNADSEPVSGEAVSENTLDVASKEDTASQETYHEATDVAINNNDAASSNWSTYLWWGAGTVGVTALVAGVWYMFAGASSTQAA